MTRSLDHWLQRAVPLLALGLLVTLCTDARAQFPPRVYLLDSLFRVDSASGRHVLQVGDTAYGIVRAFQTTGALTRDPRVRWDRLTPNIRLIDAAPSKVRFVVTDTGRFALRVTWLRNDSLRPAASFAWRASAPSGVASIIVAFDWTTTPVWSTGELGTLSDDALICAVVQHQATNSTYLGDRIARAVQVTADSVGFTLLPDTGTQVMQRCTTILGRLGPVPTFTGLHPVRWLPKRITFADLPVWLPSPEPILP